MKTILVKAIVAGIAFCTTSIAQAGTFWFPVEGHYPYSTNLIVTAVPDLDRSVGNMRTRLWQTGKKANGCRDDSPSYPCTSTYSSGNSVWGYKKTGGGDWAFDGVRYNDYEGGTGKVWLWYDNHGGYDFISSAGGTPAIHAVESGTTCGYTSSYGQVCIQHSLPTGTYRTYYTHMTNIQTKFKTTGNTVTRWDYIGNMGGTAPGGGVGVHLHFETHKLVSGTYQIVDPYGHKPGWPSNTTDDPNNPYLWE